MLSNRKEFYWKNSQQVSVLDTFCECTASGRKKKKSQQQTSFSYSDSWVYMQYINAVSVFVNDPRTELSINHLVTETKRNSSILFLQILFTSGVFLCLFPFHLSPAVLCLYQTVGSLGHDPVALIDHECHTRIIWRFTVLCKSAPCGQLGKGRWSQNYTALALNLFVLE